MEVIVRMTKRDPWTNLIKWDNCFDYIGTYWTRSGNRYTGLTPEKARELEKRLGYPEGRLDSTSDFWDTFAVKVGKKDLQIDTDTPTGELQYLFLKNHKLVADGVRDIRPNTDYVLVDVDAEAIESNKANKIKRDAFKAMDKMTIEEMRKCLRLYGVKTSNMSNELVEATLSDNIEKNPSKYLSLWVNNSNKEYNFIIEEALSKNIIRKNRATYYFGTDVIGNGIDDVIAFLKDKKNNDIFTAIKGEIESK